MLGENDGTPGAESTVDTTAENEAIVDLSKNEEGGEPKVELQQPKSEEGKKNFDAAARRVERSQRKQKLAAMQAANSEPDEIAAVEALAKAEGFDLADEQSKKQIAFNVKANALLAQKRAGKTREFLRSESKTALEGTLQDLGYVKGSPEFNFAGQQLFARMGIENPDVFADSDAVKAELENCVNALQPGKPKPTLKESLVKKAAAPKAASESKISAADSSGVKAKASELGMSEAGAKRLQETVSAKKAHKFF